MSFGIGFVVGDMFLLIDNKYIHEKDTEGYRNQ